MGRGLALTQQDVVNVMAYKAVNPDMSAERIGHAIGRSSHTVSRLAKKFEGVIAQYRELNKRAIIEDTDCVRRALLAHAANPKTIAKMSGLQALTGFGILTDKLLLESGRPTSITLNAQVDASLPDVLRRLQRAIEGRVNGATATRSSGSGDGE